jgi:glucosyl-3-phosphoglycerate synthase
MTSPLRLYHHDAFRAEVLARAKGDNLISVCIPARNEERTIGAIVETIRAELVDAVHLVDEILVADDGSSDSTARTASERGAAVVPVRPPSSSGAGKGAAMAAGLAATSGDIVAFLDGDVENFAPHFLVGLLGPLIGDPALHFVKACYRRPLNGVSGEGGRVTELVAKPLLEMFLPDLAAFSQPLAGEMATRRWLVQGRSWPVDYGVDVALLIDVTRQIGLPAMAEVDLGERVHRNRPLAELAPQARSVIAAILARTGPLDVASAIPFGGIAAPTPFALFGDSSPRTGGSGQPGDDASRRAASGWDGQERERGTGRHTAELRPHP